MNGWRHWPTTLGSSATLAVCALLLPSACSVFGLSGPGTSPVGRASGSVLPSLEVPNGAPPTLPTLEPASDGTTNSGHAEGSEAGGGEAGAFPDGSLPDRSNGPTGGSGPGRPEGTDQGGIEPARSDLGGSAGSADARAIDWTNGLSGSDASPSGTGKGATSRCVDAACASLEAEFERTLETCDGLLREELANAPARAADEGYSGPASAEGGSRVDGANSTTGSTPQAAVARDRRTAETTDTAARNDAPPEDVGSDQDDDVVARQLREAAMAETDPRLKEKLWEEYRRYKGAAK